MSRPEWLRVRYRPDKNYDYVEKLLKAYSLFTVCQEANCPNRMECYSRKTATFMILGSVCTRNCTFCDVTPGTPVPVDAEEPLHLARAVRELGLRHVVITSVTRDDLEDGGSSHFARVVGAVKELCRDVIIEVLIPDFGGDEKALLRVIESGPHIINHNVETVSRLYSLLRPQADYARSLELLSRVKKHDSEMNTKSGIMVGVGETEEEVARVMKDLRRVGCDYLTIGQYMSPSKEHYPVVEWVLPEQFDKYRDEGISLGFKGVASSPLVRSSYQAAELYEK